MPVRLKPCLGFPSTIAPQGSFIALKLYNFPSMLLFFEAVSSETSFLVHFRQKRELLILPKVIFFEKFFYLFYLRLKYKI